MKPLAVLHLSVALAVGQSFFNPLGLGELSPVSEGRVAALGGPSALSTRNPGILIELDRTAFNFTAWAVAAVGQQDHASRLIHTVRPAGLSAALPLPCRTRLLLGLDERLNQDFDIWSDSVPELPYRHHVVGRGGIYDMRVGLAKSFGNLLCVGGEYHHLFGASREDWRFEITGRTHASVDTVEATYRAHTMRAGLSVELGRLGAGAWFEPEMSLAVRSSRRVHGVVEDPIDSLVLRMPYAGAAAVSFDITAALLVAAGLEYRPWSAITIADTALATARDAFGLSFGCDYGLGRAVGRLGYSYREWYYATAAGNRISEHGLHLGTGFPITGFGAIDIAAAITRRDGGVLAEYGCRVGLTIAYTEIWQRRTRRWGY